jgi:hypothetical protein
MFLVSAMQTIRCAAKSVPQIIFSLVLSLELKVRVIAISLVLSLRDHQICIRGRNYKSDFFNPHDPDTCEKRKRTPAGGRYSKQIRDNDRGWSAMLTRAGFVCLGIGQLVMAGLVPATHALLCGAKDVGARHKAGHDDGGTVRQSDRNPLKNVERARLSTACGSRFVRKPRRLGLTRSPLCRQSAVRQPGAWRRAPAAGTAGRHGIRPGNRDTESIPR